jgi:hypothetical protein
MYETQTLAVPAYRELLDDPDRDDWDELLAATRALIKATRGAVTGATLRPDRTNRGPWHLTLSLVAHLSSFEERRGP